MQWSLQLSQCRLLHLKKLVHLQTIPKVRPLLYLDRQSSELKLKFELYESELTHLDEQVLFARPYQLGEL